MKSDKFPVCFVAVFESLHDHSNETKVNSRFNFGFEFTERIRVWKVASISSYHFITAYVLQLKELPSGWLESENSTIS